MIKHNMRPFQTFFRTVLKTFTSPAYYADILRAPFDFSLKYFLFFILLFSLVITSRVVIPLAAINLDQVGNEIIKVYPSELRVQVQNGRVAINQPLPYVIKLPNEASDAYTQPMETSSPAVVVFDSDKRVSGISDFLKYNTFALVTETTVYTRANSETNEVRAYPIPSDSNFIVDSSVLQQVKQQVLNVPFIKNRVYIPTLWIVFLPLIILANLIWRFWTALIYAVIVYVIVTVVRKSAYRNYPFTYTQILQVSFHVLTIVMTLALLLDVVGKGEFLQGTRYLLVFLIIGLLALKSAVNQLAPSELSAPKSSVVTTSEKSTKKTNSKSKK